MKVKAHQIYKTKEGKVVPGASTICNEFPKPFLVKWANNLGLEGIDSSKFVDNLADIGTLAHHRIECYIKGEDIDTSDYDEGQILASIIPFEKFLEWEQDNEFEIIESELKMVSEQYEFGGCCDIYCVLNGKKTLIDIKTSKSIFQTAYIQTSAYRQLLTENGYEVEDVRILRLGRNKNEGFADVKIPYADLHWEIFKNLRKNFAIKKEIGL